MANRLVSRIPFSKLLDQVVDTLRDGILSGRWKDTLPGRNQLAEELGVSHATTEEAMRQLVTEGFLISQGPGRRRQIVLPEGAAVKRNLLVRILAHESVDRHMPEFIDLQEKVHKAGFSASLAPKSLLELGMDVKRVMRMVQQNPADAWIVTAASREVLEWFSQQPVPAYALHGVKSGLPIAGIGVRTDIHPLIRRLAGLGHRRIVLLVREGHVKPSPSLMPRMFLKALEAEGITPGSYHLPAWGYEAAGLRRCLDRLYQTTPPTALIVNEGPLLIAVRDHLSRKGIISPRDVSLICIGHDHSFEWCDPLVAHFTWNSTAINRHVVRWLKKVARNRNERQQGVVMAEFIEGGSIGPAPKG